MKINPTKTVNELAVAISYVTDMEGRNNIYHAWRVAMLASAIAKSKLGPEGLKRVFYAGLLHDIGGAGFPFHIIHYLARRDKLSRQILLSHPIIGAQAVSDIPRLAEVAKIILDHHEWFNGQGYPRGKAGKHIACGSQLIRVADAIDICLHSGCGRNFKKLQEKLSLTVSKEYPQGLFSLACRRLKEKRLLENITDRRRIPALFEKIRKSVGAIPVPLKIDAIGQALEFAARIIDMRHPYSAGHSLRVSRYALVIALAMKLEHDEVTRIKWAGLIHDIGKMNISRYIMNKPSQLTEKEFREVKKHASFTRQIMRMLPTLANIVDIAAGHHEYFDGSGYPDGLKGTQAPLGARILVVCDAFDAMTSNRPYRTTLTPKEACGELARLSGKQFDPAITKVAIPLFKNIGL